MANKKEEIIQAIEVCLDWEYSPEGIWEELKDVRTRELIQDYVEIHVQECYLEAIAVECGEGEVAKAIAEKFPFISRVTK